MYFYPNANLKQLKLDSLFEEEELIEDIYETDVKLNYCVSPNTIYEFKKN
jgi:hypothetical protein